MKCFCGIYLQIFTFVTPLTNLNNVAKFNVAFINVYRYATKSYTKLTFFKRTNFGKAKITAVFNFGKNLFWRPNNICNISEDLFWQGIENCNFEEN